MTPEYIFQTEAPTIDVAHAYAYGGPEMSIKTMNQNFNTNTKEYVTVNFDQLATVINSLGGVTLTITEEERISANENIAALGTGSADSAIRYGIVNRRTSGWLC